MVQMINDLVIFLFFFDRGYILFMSAVLEIDVLQGHISTIPTESYKIEINMKYEPLKRFLFFSLNHS